MSKDERTMITVMGRERQVDAMAPIFFRFRRAPGDRGKNAPQATE
jgi:hypothetical protein